MHILIVRILENEFKPIMLFSNSLGIADSVLDFRPQTKNDDSISLMYFMYIDLEQKQI